jgi:G:T-mismatch repair DNA endonuclease (very short patch repair protein)
MKKFEYMIHYMNSNIDMISRDVRELNTLGAEGWEVVGTWPFETSSPSAIRCALILKRTLGE